MSYYIGQLMGSILAVWILSSALFWLLSKVTKPLQKRLKLCDGYQNRIFSILLATALAIGFGSINFGWQGSFWAYGPAGVLVAFLDFALQKVRS